MYRVSTDDTDVGCCGVIEICGFGDDDEDYDHGGNISGKTFAELLENLQNDNKGYMYHIHFKKAKKWDDTFERTWEWQGLRTLVRQIKGVKHLGIFINPNTGNKIDSYAWINK